MDNVLARNWWAVGLRGVAAIIFGILAFIQPGLTLTVLVLLYGAYALWDGVFAIISGVWHRHENKRWWIVALEGVVSIIAGIVTLLLPGLTAIVLVYVIAAWSILTGVLEIMAAIRLRKEITGEWLLMLAGILSVLLGVAMALLPGAGALALVWLIAAYAVASGVLMVALALRLRGLNQAQSSSMSPRPMG
jgi:uncharacterized membrane protein HdeD (DUF308 family)